MKHIQRLLTVSFLLIAVNIVTMAVTITPSNKYVTKVISTGSFDAVRTNTSIDIQYTVGPRKVEVVAPDNLIKYIKVSVSGSELIVNYSENMSFQGSHNSYVKISAPNVKRFTTCSSGDIKICSNISMKSETIEMLVQSAGDIIAQNLEANKVTLSTRSSGDIKTGDIYANSININVSSAGDINTLDIIGQDEVKLTTSSAGDIKVTNIVAGKNVIASTNSAGDIEIKKISVPRVSFTSNSSGDIKSSEIKVTDLEARVNSAGDITLSGICKNATLISRSTGDIKARELKAENVVAESRSAGDVICNAIHNLEALRESPTGSIKYYGNPVNVSINDRFNEGVKKMN